MLAPGACPSCGASVEMPSVSTAAPSGPGTPDAPALATHKHPAMEMLTVALPTVVTMTSYTVMQFIDGLMVSRIGADGVYLAAQGNGGMAMWLTISFTLGLTTVINTYVSQHLGAGKPERGARYAWVGLYLSLMTALPMLAVIPFLPAVFGMAGHDGRLLELESKYAQILFAGAFLTLGARSVAHYFYGMHKPLVVMSAVLLAQVVNVFANAVLIFGADGPGAGMNVGPFGWFFEWTASIAGLLGIPAMGVAGAAIGTLLGTAVEFLIPIAMFLGPMNAKYATRAAWRCGWGAFKNVLRIGWPGGLMFVNEMACWGYLMAVMLKAGGEAAAVHAAGGPGVLTPAEVSEAGVAHNAAGWIALRYMHLSFMPAVGLSIGVTAIVGRCMGMGRPDLAAQRAMLGLKIAVVYMGLCAAAFVIFREPMVRLFLPEGLSAEAASRLISIGAAVMIAAAVFQVFDAIAIVLSGALRGAGDTVWPGVATVLCSWGCIIGLGHALIVFAPQLGSMGPWIAASAFVIVLGVLLSFRFASGKWKTIKLVHDHDHPGPDDGAEDPRPNPGISAGNLPGEA